MRARHEATSANILRVTVETSCPRGGDSGHGGRTLVELEDLASTDITVTPLTNNGNGGVRLELGGDTECETLIECLRFAADELERQSKANRAGGSAK